jgi:superfamily II DNA or RNA helicase
MDDLLSQVLDHYNVLAVAQTGSGKTVVALDVAVSLAEPTLILVHSNELRKQWIREIEDKLGIPADEIGIIQQDKCVIKPITIGLLQTQARRDYSDEVYNSFGLVVVDEVHKISTEYFNDVLPNFNAKYRIGLSATPTRKDGSDIVLYAHLGQPRVRATTTVMPIKVHVDRYYTKRKLWGTDFKQRLSCLSRDSDRNDRIIFWINKLYEADRQVVVVSHSVAHIENLIRMTKDAGVPECAIGQFTATKLIYDRNYDWKVIGKRQSKDTELAEAMGKQIIFATYGMMKEAIDIPRLDSGIDATPDWKATQLLGRIRRYRKNKLYPKWITIRDMKCEFSIQMYQSRLNDYRECGAEFTTT